MRTLSVFAALALATLGAGHVEAQAPEARFAVFGDLQDTSAEGRAADRALIAQINDLAPDFSVFIGDIKGGDGDCSDALIAEVADIFAAHQAPLIYTPGDNEWTDCWREPAGSYDPVERQNAVVAAFTAPGASIGQETLELVQQDGRQENARWSAGGVVFVTLHQTGSNNNLRQDPAAIDEHLARDADNIAWLAAAFDAAEAEEAAGVVIATHANPQWDAPWWNPTGFDTFRAALSDHAAAFAGPILVLHGDTHTFRLDQPFPAADNVTRLEVFGPPDRGAVLVEVFSGEPGVFRVTPARAAR